MENVINNLKIKKKFSYSRLSLILAIIFLLPFPIIFVGVFFLQIIPFIFAIIGLIRSKNNQVENKKLAIATIVIFFLSSPLAMFVMLGNLSVVTSPKIDNKTAAAVLTRNLSMCDNLPKDSQTPCYGMIAELNKSPEDCNKISENKWTNKCKDRIAGKNLRSSCNATIMMDIEICDKVDDPNCVNAWNRVKNNPQLCNTLSTKNQDNCYETIALGICDYSYCNNIKDDKIKLNCYLQSAIKHVGGANICDDIDNLNIKKDCINKYGRNVYMTVTDF